MIDASSLGCGGGAGFAGASAVPGELASAVGSFEFGEVGEVGVGDDLPCIHCSKAARMSESTPHWAGTGAATTEKQRPKAKSLVCERFHTVFIILGSELNL